MEYFSIFICLKCALLFSKFINHWRIKFCWEWISKGWKRRGKCNISCSPYSSFICYNTLNAFIFCTFHLGNFMLTTMIIKDISFLSFLSSSWLNLLLPVVCMQNVVWIYMRSHYKCPEVLDKSNSVHVDSLSAPKDMPSSTPHLQGNLWSL